ncbi:Endospore coat-associated protein YheD [compost metagenome]
MLSKRIPAALEACNGRMAELGLDLGVDRDGRVWIIEANTKPGRSIFRKLGQEKLLLQAERNPIAYACYILSRTSIRADGKQARTKPLLCLP